MNWTGFPVNFVLGNILALAVCYTAMKALIKIQREHIQELSAERDDYRTKLHASRNDEQKLTTRINELESRPDLRSLSEMMTGHNRVINALVDKLTSRDLIFERVEEAFVKTTTALENLTTLIGERQHREET